MVEIDDGGNNKRYNVGIYTTGGQITEKNQVYGDGITNTGQYEIENAGTIGTSSAVNAIYNGGTISSR